MANNLVVPKARAGTTVTRWEYTCTSETEAFNSFGAQGWELVGAATKSFAGLVDSKWCFKRPL